MAKFNQKPVVRRKSTITTNRAGGRAYKESPELELVSLLLTSMLQDKYYESSSEQLERLQNLCCDIEDKKFLAQAAIFARTKFGMRSITHALAGELSRYLVDKDKKGFPWAKNFYDKVVYRVDDMSEILSYMGQGVDPKAKPHPIRHLKAAIRKGFGVAIGRFDEYSLSKYRSESKGVKLVDIVNIIHPPKTNQNAAVIAKLVKGELKAKDTWEVKLTKAGQKAKSEAKTDEQKEELVAQYKADEWEDLIKNKKIKYFALLRNLRNILEQNPKVLNAALEMLVDREQIKRSLVLPFRFQTAMEEIGNITGTRKVVSAINKAIEISLDNVPKFEGKTLIVLDKSGSMSGKPVEIGSLFAAVLYKANDADYMEFETTARYVNIPSDDSVTTIAKSMRNADGGGTNFEAIFPACKKAYDRVIILSDCQGWMGQHGGDPRTSFMAYKKKFNCSPKVYSFDLNGYGQLMFPEKDVFAVAGFSEKIFEFMGKVEVDRNAMVNEIRKIEI